jgi:hypothetical protein
MVPGSEETRRAGEEERMPRRSAGFILPRVFGLSQLLVVVALILTILDLLGMPLRGIPLIPLAVLLLCIAWLVP